MPNPLVPPRGMSPTSRFIQSPSTFIGRVTTAFKFVFGKVRAYASNFTDRARRLSWDQVTTNAIESALHQAWLGFMQPIAEVYDLMRCSPILRGIRNQLIAGVKGVTPELTVPPSVEAGRQALAEEILAATRAAMDNPDAPFTKFVEQYVECRLRGGGLIEPLWIRKPDGTWTWNGFNLVPQQRVRFDRYTGEIAFSESSFQYFGQPVSSFPRGTFVVCNPEKEIPDFSKRGTYRAVLTDWFAMQNVGGWWQSDIEWVGSPLIVGEYDDDTARETMNKAFEEMGANPKLAVRKGSNVQIVERSPARGPKGSVHNEFETTRTQRMSIAFLGATQTVSVDANTGSQESSDVMADVRDEVLVAYWEDIIADSRRDLLQVFVGLNYGWENVDLTPIMGVDLEEPADAAALLDSFGKGADLGLEVGENFARKKLKWPAPAPGEKPLRRAAPALPPAASAAPGAPGGRPRPVPADPKKPEEEAA